MTNNINVSQQLISVHQSSDTNFFAENWAHSFSKFQFN